ncbi:hypothetical protein JIQ42_07352 [Leishmania sp. Namibia]|uniref:hypothetical protein n=1 Tax=Leishmania sp. Namibia TaxID=2802991 RepID=UPI001B51FFBA|nr:hypothetical protein JIQ42_07352 [Leishmania sp. Namibia]
MLPTISKRGRAPKSFDAEPPTSMPGGPDSVGGEARGGAPSVDLATPVGAEAATVDRTSHGRVRPVHSSACASLDFRDAVTAHAQTASTKVGEVTHGGCDRGQSQRSLLPTVAEASATGPAADGAPPLRDSFASPKAANLVTGTPIIRCIPTPDPSASPADTRSVQLLQNLQQMLQSGAPAATLQQWVSHQLCHATLPATPARPTAGVLVVPPPPERPLAPTALSAAALGQPTSPGIPGGSRPLRRPASAVSFSLSTHPHPYMQQQQQQQQQLAPRQRSSLDGANTALEPFCIPSALESICTASSGNASSALTSARDGGAGVLASAMSSATPVIVTLPMEADTGAPLSGASLPPLAGSAGTTPLGRGPSTDVDDPHAGSGGSDVGLAAAHQRSTGSSLRKASRPQLQHPQWRSFRSHSSNADHSSPVASPGGTPPATVSGAGASAATSAIVFHSTPSSPVGTPKYRRVASALHSATKAALHATTSQVVTENQQNISLILGGRFSRHHENFARHVAAPLPLGRRSSSGTPVLAETTRGAGCSRGRSHVGADVGSDGDDNSSFTTSTTALERLGEPGGSLAAQQAPFASVASVPQRAAERGAVAAMRFPTCCRPSVSALAAASASCPAPELVSNHTRPAIEPPGFAGAVIGFSGGVSSGVSSLQAHYSVSGDRSAVSIAPCDTNSAALAGPPRMQAAAAEPAHYRSNSIPPELSTNPDAEAQLQVSLCLGRPSSRLPAVMAAGTPAAATEVAPDSTAEPMASTEVQYVVSLIEMDMEATSVSCAPARGLIAHNTSLLPSSGDSHQLPCSWGGAAARAGERSHCNPQRSCVSTLPPVSTSATPFAWTHLPPNQSSPTAALAASLSQLTSSTPVAAPCMRQASVPLRRTTSFASITSSHLGGGGATGGRGASSLLNLTGGDSVSLHDDTSSFGSGHTAGVSSLGDGMIGNRRHPSSVLHLSRLSMNGGVDPMDGVMASFILDDISGAARRSGPRFLRAFCRHTPVRVTESVTHEELEKLGVPFIEGIDAASVPTNVLALMEAYGFTDSCAFYVAVCLNVFLRYAFVQRFGWNVEKLRKFLEVAATYFRRGNPFHNPLHAVDVVIAAHQWVGEGSTSAALSDDEVMTFLFTATVQQLAHTGADNRLLARLKHPYAMLCSYASPQQGATVALVMALLSRPELRFLPAPFLATTGAAGAGSATDPADAQEWTTSRESHMYDMLADLIMATDERNHAALKQSIVRMGEMNARRHGCLCASAHADRSASQTDNATRLQYPSPLGSFCLNCCAYITDMHVPNLLKAVLHFIDFAYLFRPYEVYLSGNIAYMAEVYRQMEREYLLLQRVQKEQLLKALRGRANGERLGEEVPSRRSDARSPGAPFSAPAADACTPAVALAMALLAEQQPWRQGVAQASTMTSLQRNNDEAPTAADTPPPLRGGAVVHLSSEIMASRRSVRLPLQAEGEKLLQQVVSVPQDADVGSSNALRSAARLQPLKGLGRDIVLISLEDLCLPFLEQLAPYMPEAWVAASYRNHQALMKSLPTPEKFDEVVNRLLDMGEETEAEELEEDSEKDNVFEDEEDSLTAERPFTLPWRLLRPVRPVAAEWTVNKDGLVRRVLMEIMRGPEELLKERDGC